MSIFITILHLGTLAVLLWGTWMGMNRVRIYTALFAGLSGYQLLVIPVLSSFIDVYGAPVVLAGELIAIVSSTILVGVLEYIERCKGRSACKSLGPVIQDVVDSPRRYMAAFFFAMIAVLLITARRGDTLLEMGWEESRASLGIADSAATLLLFLVFPGFWIAWRSRSRLLAAFVAGCAVILTAVYGSRAAFLTIPAVIAVDLHTRGILTQSKKSLILGTTGVLLLVLALHVGGRMVRGLGLGGLLALIDGSAGLGSELLQSLDNIDWTGGELDIFTYYFFVVSEGSIPGVEPLATLARWLLMYLPRFLADAVKPVDPTYVLWTHAANSGLFDGEIYFSQVISLVRLGDQGSLHPTFWGEAWMNGGWAAVVIISATLGVIVFVIDEILMASPSDVVAMVAPAVVVGYLMVARGNSTIGLGYFAYLYPAAWMLHAMISGVILAAARLRLATSHH